MTAACRYDSDADTYLLPSHLPRCDAGRCRGCQPCEKDDNGNPTRHCEGRRYCAGHLDDAHPRVCPKCIGKVRETLKRTQLLSELTIVEALGAGLESEAAYLAGPSADPEARAYVGQSYLTGRLCRCTPRETCPGRLPAPAGPLCHTCRSTWPYEHTSCGWIIGPRCPDALAWLEEKDDPHHPTLVLARCELSVRDLLNHPRPTGRDTGVEVAFSITRSVSYLDWALTDIAQRDDFDWSGFAGELNACITHLETVLHNSWEPETGAPCPVCSTRLERRYASHTQIVDGEQVTVGDTSGAGDQWKCPNKACGASWQEADYRLRVGTDYLDNARKLTAAELGPKLGLKPSTIRVWGARDDGLKAGRDEHGITLYDVDAVTARHERLNNPQVADETTAGV